MGPITLHEVEQELELCGNLEAAASRRRLIRCSRKKKKRKSLTSRFRSAFEHLTGREPEFERAVTISYRS